MVAWGIVAVLVAVLLALAFGAFHFEQPIAAILPTFSVHRGGVYNGLSWERVERGRTETAAAMAASREAGHLGILPIGPRPAALNLGVLP